MPIIVAGAIAAGGAIAGSVIGSKASKSAAKTQTDAANRSADLQYKLGQDSLGFQREMWQQGRNDMMPWLNTGKAALGALGGGMGLGGDTGQSPAASALGRPGSLGSPLYRQPQMVMMVAPTGEQKQVPIAMVPHLVARGAKRVQ